MFVHLMTEVSDATALTDRIKESNPHSRRSMDDDPKTFVLHVYDPKNAGEASSNPSTRAPPLRGNGDHLKLCLRAALDSQDSVTGAMASNDIFLLFDCGRPGRPHSCTHEQHLQTER